LFLFLKVEKDGQVENDQKDSADLFLCSQNPFLCSAVDFDFTEEDRL
jgi:hypothetical protein